MQKTQADCCSATPRAERTASAAHKTGPYASVSAISLRFDAFLTVLAETRNHRLLLRIHQGLLHPTRLLIRRSRLALRRQALQNCLHRYLPFILLFASLSQDPSPDGKKRKGPVVFGMFYVFRCCCIIESFSEPVDLGPARNSGISFAELNQQFEEIKNVMLFVLL